MARHRRIADVFAEDTDIVQDIGVSRDKNRPYKAGEGKIICNFRFRMIK
jgi:hypothetical protein